MNLDMNRIIELSKDLIRYKSFTGMERDIGGYISNFFKNAGIEYSIFEKERGRPNIIANIGNGEKTIALSGHFDVVPIANENLWEMNPFAPEVKENRLYGRGSYDMKASCAVMMHIAEIFSKENLKGNLQICLVSDEEKGAEFGTKYIIDLIKKGEIKKPDFAIVGEGSD